MNTFLSLNQLSPAQFKQYTDAIPLAFPEIIVRSEHIKEYWPKLENYFPSVQLYLVDQFNDLIGFMNTIPFYWDQPLNDLPDQGWDWMLQKGIEDHEAGIKANSLGGLQVIVLQKYQRQGYSQIILSQAKLLVQKLAYQHFVIPIRPILKSNHPEIPMLDYLKKKDRFYDPWIGTHINNGAEILKVCSESMKVSGNLKFWEELIGHSIKKSKAYKVKGALNFVDVNIEADYGQYLEENIWITYS